jgi:hypothetical protein
MGSDCLTGIWLLPQILVRSKLFSAAIGFPKCRGWMEHGFQDLLEILKRHFGFLPVPSAKHRPTLPVANTGTRSWVTQ